MKQHSHIHLILLDLNGSQLSNAKLRNSILYFTVNVNYVYEKQNSIEKEKEELSNCPIMFLKYLKVNSD